MNLVFFSLCDFIVFVILTKLILDLIKLFNLSRSNVQDLSFCIRIFYKRSPFSLNQNYLNQNLFELLKLFHTKKPSKLRLNFYNCPFFPFCSIKSNPFGFGILLAYFLSIFKTTQKFMSCIGNKA